MRYFLDTEFIEDGHCVDLLSVGIVAEDGREFYAENQECDLSLANDWVKENVIPHLWHRQADKREYNAWLRDGGQGGVFTREMLWREVNSFCSVREYGRPEFWTDCGAFDYVALSNLFGGMAHWPDGWPYYFNDLMQWADQLGASLMPQFTMQHHALEDARHNRKNWEMLNAHCTGGVLTCPIAP